MSPFRKAIALAVVFGLAGDPASGFSGTGKIGGPPLQSPFASQALLEAMSSFPRSLLNHQASVRICTLGSCLLSMALLKKPIERLIERRGVSAGKAEAWAFGLGIIGEQIRLPLWELLRQFAGLALGPAAWAAVGINAVFAALHRLNVGRNEDYFAYWKGGPRWANLTFQGILRTAIAMGMTVVFFWTQGWMDGTNFGGSLWVNHYLVPAAAAFASHLTYDLIARGLHRRGLARWMPVAGSGVSPAPVPGSSGARSGTPRRPIPPQPMNFKTNRDAAGIPGTVPPLFIMPKAGDYVEDSHYGRGTVTEVLEGLQPMVGVYFRAKSAVMPVSISDLKFNPSDACVIFGLDANRSRLTPLMGYHRRLIWTGAEFHEQFLFDHLIIRGVPIHFKGFSTFGRRYDLGEEASGYENGAGDIGLDWSDLEGGSYVACQVILHQAQGSHGVSFRTVWAVEKSTGKEIFLDAYHARAPAHHGRPWNKVSDWIRVKSMVLSKSGTFSSLGANSDEISLGQTFQDGRASIDYLWSNEQHGYIPILATAWERNVREPTPLWFSFLTPPAGDLDRVTWPPEATASVYGGQTQRWSWISNRKEFQSGYLAWVPWLRRAGDRFEAPDHTYYYLPEVGADEPVYGIYRWSASGPRLERVWAGSRVLPLRALGPYEHATGRHRRSEARIKGAG